MSLNTHAVLVFGMLVAQTVSTGTNDKHLKIIIEDIGREFYKLTEDIKFLRQEFANQRNWTRHEVNKLTDEFSALSAEIKNHAKELENYHAFQAQMERERTEFSQFKRETMAFLAPMSSSKKVSFAESNAYSEQARGCGGILVGERGKITFQSPIIPINQTFVCLWTVRANLRTRVAFQLIADNLGANFYIKLTSLQQMFVQTLTPSETIYASSREELVLDGPVVFVFLVAVETSQLSFTLSFEGRGSNANSMVEYRHYHHIEPENEISYPQIRGVDTYAPNEIATFAINPQRTPFDMTLSYVDIEPSSECQHDSLAFLSIVKETSNSDPTYRFARVTSPNRKFHLSKKGWYCMENKISNENVIGSLVDNRHNQLLKLAYMVVFKSDSTNEKKGFKFSWPRLE